MIVFPSFYVSTKRNGIIIVAIIEHQDMTTVEVASKLSLNVNLA